MSLHCVINHKLLGQLFLQKLSRCASLLTETPVMFSLYSYFLNLDMYHLIDCKKCNSLTHENTQDIIKTNNCEQLLLGNVLSNKITIHYNALSVEILIKSINYIYYRQYKIIITRDRRKVGHLLFD